MPHKSRFHNSHHVALTSKLNHFCDSCWHASCTGGGPLPPTIVWVVSVLTYNLDTDLGPSYQLYPQQPDWLFPFTISPHRAVLCWVMFSSSCRKSRDAKIPACIGIELPTLPYQPTNHLNFFKKIPFSADLNFQSSLNSLLRCTSFGTSHFYLTILLHWNTHTFASFLAVSTPYLVPNSSS